MRSRVLIGASAWLLGALTATGGSMLAVSQLAHGLLGPGAEQLTPAVVRADLAGYQHSGAGSAVAGRSAAQGGPSPLTSQGAGPAQSPRGSAPGTLLVSQAGSVVASCQSGLAYLQYWSPDQGFQADDVIRGPVAQASLTFEGYGPAIRMRVTCRGGEPTARASVLSYSNDSPSGGDE